MYNEYLNFIWQLRILKGSEILQINKKEPEILSQANFKFGKVKTYRLTVEHEGLKKRMMHEDRIDLRE